MSSAATLFLNAPLPPKPVLDHLIPQINNSHIICADGGYLFARKLPIKVDTIIGDLDTVKKANILIDPTINVIEKPSQNLNDFEKALVHLQNKNYKQILLLGLTGDRTDHVLANLSVLSRYYDQFDFDIYGQEAKIYLITKHKNRLSFNMKPNFPVSLVPLPEAFKITTGGLKYPLQKDDLLWGIKEGSSNEAIREMIEIEIGAGLLAVFANYNK